MMIVTERKGEAQSVLELIKSTPGQVRKELSEISAQDEEASSQMEWREVLGQI